MSLALALCAIFVSLILIVAIVRLSIWVSEKRESRRVSDASYGAPGTSDSGPMAGGAD